MLVPLRVKLPLPCLKSLPVPEMTPAKLVLLLLAPVTRTALLRLTWLPATPASEPMSSSLLSRSVAPAATVTAEASPMTLPPCTARVPACTLVAPP